MNFRAGFLPLGAKDFRGLEAVLKPRIVKALDAIQVDPLSGKPLQGAYHGLRSYRVGDYRIVYRMDSSSKTVLIHRIGHRRDIYRS